MYSTHLEKFMKNYDYKLMKDRAEKFINLVRPLRNLIWF